MTESRCPISADAEAFDPFTGDYQVDPAAALRWSREQEPVFYAPKLGYWVVTRYDDVKAVFRDHAHFSPAIALEKITPTVQAVDEVLRDYDYGMNRTLVNEDEPDHLRRRRALMQPFTAEALAPREEMVRRLAREAVDSFVDRGTADLVAEMLYFVPLTVAMHFMGIPEEDMGPLQEFSVAHTVNTWGRPAPAEQVRIAHQVGRFWQYAGGVLERMREQPDRPGWMPYSIRVQADERAAGCPVGTETVTDSYLHSMMMAGIVAAHETTAHAGANAVRLLLEEPERWQQLCDDPMLIPNAVEECLRLRGSVAAWRRIALADTEVGGVAIPKGSKLLIVQASANHDEDRFENADNFDVYRTEASDHLTFGYGVHQCLGKNLARMELQVFLEELTTRLPHLRLAQQEFTFVPNTSFRGPERLLVEWEPEHNPERRNPEILQHQQTLRIGEPSRHTLGRTVRVVEVVPETAEVSRVVLADPSGKPLPAWHPGSHLDVQCGTDANGRPRSRQYSLCGRPGPHWEVAVLREDDGRGGSRWLHEHTRAGAHWRVRGPSNHFRLDRGEASSTTDSPVLLIAGGIGITPIAAMAHALQAAGRAYTLHYSGRSRQTMALLDRLQAEHGDRLVVHAADEGGRADYPAILASTGEAEVYACGPQRLLDALAELVPAERLHVEHFTSSLGELDPCQEHAFELRLADSGQTLVVPPDRTVLDTLRAANLDVPSDCEEGLCGTCEVPVLAGQVDDRDLVLDAGERAANRSMMSCCSRARGDALTLGL